MFVAGGNVVEDVRRGTRRQHRRWKTQEYRNRWVGTLEEVMSCQSH